LTEVSSELLRDKLLALAGAQVSEAEVSRLLAELLSCGGGVTLELDDLRLKLVRREGRFTFKKEESRRASSFPPKNSGLR
jgi:hypothetical protein